MIEFSHPSNLLQRTKCDYDAWNRLVRVWRDVKLVAAYEYDGLGRRIVKRDFRPTWSTLTLEQMGEMSLEDWNELQGKSASRHYYYSQNWQVLEERLEAPGQPASYWPTDRRYVWGVRGLDDLVFRDRYLAGARERLYALSDAGGNVVSLYKAGEFGQEPERIVERIKYDAYGCPRFMDKDFQGRIFSAHRWNILFGGYHYDGETGLYHVRNRFYHPEYGRWLQTDPAGFRDSYNPYQYCLSSPHNFVDPTGEAIFVPVLAAAAIYLLVAAARGALWASVETPVEAGIAGLTGDESFHFGNAWMRNFAVNTALSLIPGGAESKIAYKSARWGSRLLGRSGIVAGHVLGPAAFRVGAGTAADFAWLAGVEGRSTGAAFGEAFGGNLGGQALHLGGRALLRSKWFSNLAGEWRGWREGFANTGDWNWKKARERFIKTYPAMPWDEIHHRILAQGGTRNGAGRLTLRGFFEEQYGRYIPNFIKNSRLNLRNMGQPLWRGGSGLHEALHGNNPRMRLNVLERVWHGTNIWDKAAIGTVAVGTAYWLSD